MQNVQSRYRTVSTFVRALAPPEAREADVVEVVTTVTRNSGQQAPGPEELQRAVTRAWGRWWAGDSRTSHCGAGRR